MSKIAPAPRFNPTAGPPKSTAGTYTPVQSLIARPNGRKAAPGLALARGLDLESPDHEMTTSAGKPRQIWLSKGVA